MVRLRAIFITLADLKAACNQTLAQIKEAGTYKVERVITSSQSAEIEV